MSYRLGVDVGGTFTQHRDALLGKGIRTISTTTMTQT